MKNVKEDKLRVPEYQNAKLERLREEMVLNEEVWRDDPGVFETLKEITLINVVPYADTLILYPANKKEHKTGSGIIIPATANRDNEDISFAMVVSISAKAKEKLDFPCELGSMVLFNKAFLVKEVLYNDFRFFIVQPHAILFKVPTSEIRSMVITADPLAVFHPEIIDMSRPEEKAKVMNTSMPSGMIEGDQEKQINPEEKAQIKAEEEADRRTQVQVSKPPKKKKS